MENLNIIPYVAVDGIMSFPNSRVMGFYDQMAKDGSAEDVFLTGDIRSREDFLRYMQRPGVMLYVLAIGQDLVGVVWLDGIENKSAYMHFCAFSTIWGKVESVGKETIRRLINLHIKDGEYAFDLFKGQVPSSNTRAINFAKRCGGKILGEIPQCLWNANKNKSESATFIYYTREGAQ